MAQQVFNQWAPVAKAQNEQGQEVYLPFAGIHAQTRDGKDEVIVGAGNMVWTGSMWVPVSDQNRLPVEATLTGHLGTEAVYDHSSGPVAAGVTTTIVDVNRPIVLSLLQISTETPSSTRLFVEAYKSDGSLNIDWRIMDSSLPGMTRRFLLLSRIVEGDNVFGMYTSNEDATIYYLREEHVFPFGVGIRVQNQDTENDRHIALTWAYREVG